MMLSLPESITIVTENSDTWTISSGESHISIFPDDIVGSSHFVISDKLSTSL
jgi:hypothetical protein